MGSYGIGVGRLLGCIAEEYHDEAGFRWPVAVAPYDVHVVDIADDPDSTRDIVEKLEGAGLTVLVDGRTERAGVKFNDADLLGMPYRITIGKRSLQEHSVEFTIRRLRDKNLIPIEQVVPTILDRRAVDSADLTP